GADRALHRRLGRPGRHPLARQHRRDRLALGDYRDVRSADHRAERTWLRVEVGGRALGVAADVEDGQDIAAGRQDEATVAAQDVGGVAQRPDDVGDDGLAVGLDDREYVV